MQRSKFAEKNVSTQNVSNQSLIEYNWPYSQPRIVNSVRATSRMGILMGVISSILILSDSYIENGYLIIDALLTLGFIILRLFTIPSIRRGQIKYVASESRNLNKFIVMASCIFMYAGLIRFIVANGLFIANQGFEFSRYIQTLFPSINTVGIVIGVVAMFLPTIFMVFPKDVSVREYHHKMRNIWNEYSVLNRPVEPEPVTSYEPRTIQRAPNYMPGTYVNHRTSRPETHKPVASTTSQTITTQQTNNKSHKNQNKKSNHLTPQQKPSVSVWDSEKSVRRPRK